MAVALHDLVGDGLEAQAELGADQLLDPRIDVVVGAHGAAQLADGGAVGHAPQAVEVAGHLEGPHPQLHAEGDGLGVDAVGAPHLHRVAKLEGAPLEHLAEGDEVALEKPAGTLDLQRQTGVEHVRARHAIVDVLRGVADVLGHVGQKGDDVMVGGLLDLGDAGGVKPGPRLDLGHGLVGDPAEPVPGAHRRELDLEPGPQLGFVGPDGAHLGQRVAIDHGEPSAAAVRDGQILSHKARRQVGSPVGSPLIAW